MGFFQMFIGVIYNLKISLEFVTRNYLLLLFAKY